MRCLSMRFRKISLEIYVVFMPPKMIENHESSTFQVTTRGDSRKLPCDVGGVLECAGVSWNEFRKSSNTENNDEIPTKRSKIMKF